MEQDFRFGDEAEGPGLARRFVVSRLREVPCRAPEDIVALLTSELVTNAIRHGGGGGRVEVECPDDKTARVMVWDSGGDTVPEVRQPGEHGLDGGFGLLLVADLADAWGAEQTNGDQRVWFEVSAPR